MLKENEEVNGIWKIGKIKFISNKIKMLRRNYTGYVWDCENIKIRSASTHFKTILILLFFRGCKLKLNRF